MANTFTLHSSSYALQSRAAEPILFWVGQCGNAYVRYNLKKVLKMLNTDCEQKAKSKVKKSDNFEQFQIHRCCTKISKL